MMVIFLSPRSWTDLAARVNSYRLYLQTQDFGVDNANECLVAER